MKRRLVHWTAMKAEDFARRLSAGSCAAPLLALALWSGTSKAAENADAAQFRRAIQPILTEFCNDCHADGANKGGVRSTSSQVVERLRAEPRRERRGSETDYLVSVR